ncbi:MAG: sigma-70 family RNA polymerase sigma factor [Planctomycetia bacterium]
MALFTKCQCRIQAFIRTLVHDPTQADDVFQATSLVLWRSFSTFRRDAEFLPWALGTARHQVLLHWRTRRRDRHVFSEALLADLADCTENSLDSTEWRMAALEACIAGLSDRQRELLRMFYGEDRRAEAIAKHWGRTVHTVYKALKVMRKALFDCVSRKLCDFQSLDEAGSRPAIS